MKPTTAMLISRLEYLVAPFGCKPLEDSRQVPMNAGELRTLLRTIRELDNKHPKHSRATTEKSRYYSPE